MIVRLKELTGNLARQAEKSFNSMIVRLKVFVDIRNEKFAFEFQFYDSPIKSVPQCGHVSNTNVFQFYDSPIKSHFPDAILRIQYQVSIL